MCLIAPSGVSPWCLSRAIRGEEREKRQTQAQKRGVRSDQRSNGRAPGDCNIPGGRMPDMATRKILHASRSLNDR